jgi:transcription elongation factor GreA
MDENTLMTAADHEALLAELAVLEGEGRRAMAARIKTAREWGDLKENSEYHDAKSVSSDGGVVGFGSTVHVRDEEGREQRFEIVSSQTAAPATGKISIESPVARGLLGLSAGEQAQITLPRGTRRYTVLSVA